MLQVPSQLIAQQVAWSKFLLAIKGMSPETLTVYLEYRERLLERQQRVQMEQLHLKLRHEQELELKKNGISVTFITYLWFKGNFCCVFIF
jgi:hypothetical protein